MHLRNLGIRPRQDHPELGDISVLLKKYVLLKYLTKINIPSANSDVYEYKWGQRAIAEWPEKNMIDFITDVSTQEFWSMILCAKCTFPTILSISPYKIFNVKDDFSKRQLGTVIKAAAEISVPDEGD